jgi:hypothetical protein
MSVVEGRAKLIKAGKKLMSDWYQVKEVWRDENCRQFEKKYINQLETDIRAAAQAMEHIGAMLASARRDCGSSREVDL